MMTIWHPLNGKILFVPNEEQELMLEAFQKFRRVIIRKDRQVGASVALAKFALVEAASVPNCRILVITYNQVNVKSFLRKVADSGANGFHSHTSIGVDFTNGSTIKVRTTNPNLPIQPSESFDLIIMDEYEWTNIDISDVLQATKKLIAVSSKRTADSFGFETLKVLDSINIELETHSKLCIFGVV